MNIFVLTGAGISAASGLGTFRDKDGLWTHFDPMKLATPEAFARDPNEVHAFYNMRRRNLIEAEPNAAHHALARLEAGLGARGGRLFLCTQNIDDLHERAGSQQVTHMHGELLKARCVQCNAVTLWHEDLSIETPCLSCGCAGGLRPHVVWFGELPLFMDAIYDAMLDADLFVAIGTSGSVYPAAGFVSEARGHGIRTCEINLEPSDNARRFDERRYGPASEAIPAWVKDVLTA
ncbi:NAD-dependent deacylase [Microvirga sp. 17 mud 1-3]|uniref:NAD-dependent deacylase n=1 Tax=Microvirga sp. 17 mud 1-3 TaxID=2082949 RepID=UPI000D6CEC3E|nr:NAD-dependent deacylase [Microvirga sp. 17 mud 1-3]AWM86811.1 NAD-dependent protein deacylase [Microvirga sp. 17 mud 1-3]